MDKHITIINPYFENHEMLKEQQREWESWPDWIKARTSFIIVDDCSKDKPAINAVNEKRTIDLEVYRIKIKIRWNWLICRNLGAYKAKDGFLFLTDIDHLVPLKTIEALHERNFSKEKFYLFNRHDAPFYTKYKPHPNTYFMHKDLYWKIGGYDESFAGHYGTDGMYRRRCVDIAGNPVETGLIILRYPRNVIADASTTKYARKQGRDKKHALNKIMETKARLGEENVIKVLQCPWEKLI